MIPAVKRGDAVAVSAGGEPPALFTSTSSAPKRSTVAAITASTWSGSRTSAATNSQPVGQVVGLVAAADRDVRAGVGEALRDAPADAATTAGDEHDAPVESRQLGGVVHGGGVYDLTPTRRLPRCRASPLDHEEHRVPVPDKRVTIDDIVGHRSRTA